MEEGESEDGRREAAAALSPFLSSDFGGDVGVCFFFVGNFFCHLSAGLQQGAVGGGGGGCRHHANNHPGGLFQQ